MKSKPRTRLKLVEGGVSKPPNHRQATGLPDYHSAFRFATDFFSLSSAQGELFYLNPAFEELTSFTPESWVGKNLASLFHSEDCDVLNDTIRHPDCPSSCLSVRMRKQDGGYLPVELTLSPVPQKNNLTQWLAVARDQTTRVRIERELRGQIKNLETNLQQQISEKTADLIRSNSELEQFAYVASHDLQEPARMVASFCQLLNQQFGGKLGADADKWLYFAGEGSRRMQALINDLLLYSRLETQAKPFLPTSCSEVLKEAIGNLRTVIESSSAIIVLGDLPTLTADRSQLVQLFQNLIGNAIKFRGAAAPRVTVSVQKDPRGWLFSVSDNGIGIESDHYLQIFDIFRRLHSRERYPGNGIGLAICKRVVMRHGGKIWVQSAAGEGSVFCFTLPDSPAQKPISKR